MRWTCKRLPGVTWPTLSSYSRTLPLIEYAEGDTVALGK